MKSKSFMLIAGEASGDWLAAELVRALREQYATAAALPTTDYQPLETSLEPRFFGAGGPRMAAAGVGLVLDLTEHSVIGVSDVLRNYFKFRRIFRQLYRLALEREPNAIVCVDFSGFNRRFAHAIKRYVRSHADWFHGWQPKIIQYVSPQVWASREGRVYQLARDYDLILSLFGFEREWYAQRVPQLHVEFVGHPIVDRYLSAAPAKVPNPPMRNHEGHSLPTVLLLPGSRVDELKRHLPVMVGTLDLLQSSFPSLRPLLVLPNAVMLQQARAVGLPETVEVNTGGLAEVLPQADVAIASTGTVTLECACWGVPTVAIYKASWSDYQIAKRLVKVKYLAMPNILAKDEVFPEFIQAAATAPNMARAAYELLHDTSRRARIKAKLAEVRTALGPPGASRRAAQAVKRLLEPTSEEAK